MLSASTIRKVCLGGILALSSFTLLADSSLQISSHKNDELLLKVFVFGSLAIIFAAMSFVLIRLNKRLKNNISSHQATEQMMSKLSSAVTNSGASIVMTNADGVIEYVNQKFCRSNGYLHHEVIGQSIDILSPESHLENETRQLLDNSCLKSAWEGEALCVKKNGTEYWCAITVAAVYNKDRIITNYVLSAIDISALKDANSKMQNLALFDSLTGLANRRLFIDRLHQSVLSARRHKHTSAIMFLDLDQFKRINDTLGHQAGDELLSTIAERLKTCVRKQDTVARLGGDEFTILLNDISNNDKISSIAEYILAILKKPIKLGKHEVIVSTSIGITIAPSDSTCSETLMRNADMALYRAKERGRDGYCFFTEELNVRASHLMEIEHEIRHALSNDEFYLHYQPQIDLKTNKINSVEALIRWRHPVKGEISPNDFISIAEETGLIVPIGDWVLKKACSEIHQLNQDSGLDLRVAVNLSTRQFTDLRLVNTVNNALETAGMPARNLELEVTESMLMQDMETVIDQLNRIKAYGCTVSIDDFGSGYSSFSYLKSLPVDILKVDREFVRDIPEDLNAMEITSAIIAVAHKLNLKVVAEGVESEDQRDFLDINKCDFAQGYFFSKPINYGDLRTFFLEREHRLAEAV
ncbi:MAG: EAL domain-containing protein [Oleiphilaceae bacterium]|nr:EAL domain-containing protein [Oleiphilaceae bacterium]